MRDQEIVLQHDPMDLALRQGLSESLQELSKHLGKKTPRNAIQTRPGPRGMKLSYVPWSWVARRLNEAFGPTWSFEMRGEPKHLPLPPLQKEGKMVERQEVMVSMRLTTPLGFQDATSSHTYFPSNAEILYGDVVASAQSKALR